MEEIFLKIFGVVSWLQKGLILAGIIGFLTGCFLLLRTSKRDLGKDTLMYCLVALALGCFVLPGIKFFVAEIFGFPELVQFFN